MSRMWKVSQFRSGKLQVTSPQFPEFHVLLTIFYLSAVLPSCYGTNAKIPLVSDDLPETRHHEPGTSLTVIKIKHTDSNFKKSLVMC